MHIFNPAHGGYEPVSVASIISLDTELQKQVYVRACKQIGMMLTLIRLHSDDESKAYFKERLSFYKAMKKEADYHLEFTEWLDSPVSHIEI